MVKDPSKQKGAKVSSLAIARSDPILEPLLSGIDSRIMAYKAYDSANRARMLLRRVVEGDSKKSYDRAVEILQDDEVSGLLRRVFPEVLVMSLTHKSGPIPMTSFVRLARWAAGTYALRGKDIWGDDTGLP
ncbi:MAG: hypothetical protein KGH58_02725 [Candidatus Micrarchaeota archaeon]|nr:hypothetical protein [Candidatus Micrarchaeota archaeon]